MKKIFLKVLVIAVIVLIANNVFFMFLGLPFYWGNDIASTKARYLLNHKNEFNSIFIGRSKTQFQIDVLAFDSLTKHQTKSFNF